MLANLGSMTEAKTFTVHTQKKEKKENTSKRVFEVSGNKTINKLRIAHAESRIMSTNRWIVDQVVLEACLGCE